LLDRRLLPLVVGLPSGAAGSTVLGSVSGDGARVLAVGETAGEGGGAVASAVSDDDFLDRRARCPRRAFPSIDASGFGAAAAAAAAVLVDLDRSS